MVIVLSPKEQDIDGMALRVFLKAIEILGGPRKLIEYRNLTWLPSLMSASYAIVYNRERGYNAESIARILGISTTTARNILNADENIAKEKLQSMLEDKEVDESKRTHTAGALAKMAYREIKQGRDEINLMLHLAHETSKSLGVDWAVKVLSMIKGTDFPMDRGVFLEKLKGVKIQGKTIEEIAQKMSFPIHTPAELLHKIKLALEG